MTGQRTSQNGHAARPGDPGFDADLDAERSADEGEEFDDEVEVPLDPPLEVPVADLVDQLSAVPLPDDEDR